MKLATLRARVTLWSVGVVTIALALFAAGAAWSLRQELIENLDKDIKAEAHDFFIALKEQRVDWRDRRSVEALFDQSKQLCYLEIRNDAGHVFYRSQELEKGPAFLMPGTPKLQNIAWNGRALRFGMFRQDGIVLGIGGETKEITETVAELLVAYIAVLPVVIVAVGFGAWWIAQRAVAPVQAIAAQAQTISASDLRQRLAAPSSQDEIAHLAFVLNGMFDRLQRSFDQVTRFTSDASHELRTPLALMRAEAESTLGARNSTPDQRELCANVIKQCLELSHIVDGLLFLSRADNRHLALEQETVDLTSIVRELREDAEILALPLNLTLQCDLPSELRVRGDRRLLSRALMNLIDNAIKYNRAGGAVVISALVHRETAVLTIRNNGNGIFGEAKEKVFDRFYRGDSLSGDLAAGHGLGLSIAREIARAHNGDVTLLRSDRQWTEFCMTLPIASDSERMQGRTSTNPSVRQTYPDAMPHVNRT
jgi:two-component system, OmpR family, heavy metal sensor histidine kinase CusS